jgi:flagellar hook-length control protein FliK
LTPSPTPLALKAVKGNGDVASLPGKDGVDSLTRRAVWNDFLRKMKNEFGISAEDVLHAFSSLSDEDLAKPPGETVDKLVMALGLNDQQAALAKQYFQELIQKTRSRSLGEELAASSKQINLSLMSQREMRLRSMDRALERMNRDFFMKGRDTAAIARAMDTSPQPNSQRLAAATASVDGKTPTAAQKGRDALAALTPDFSSATTPALSMPDATTAPSVAADTTGSLAGTSTLADPSAPVPATAGKDGVFNPLAAGMQPVDGKDRSVDQLIRKFMATQTGAESKAVASGASAHHAAALAAGADPGAMTQTAAANTAPSAATALATPPAAAAMTSLNHILAGLQGGGADDGADTDGDSSDASYLNAPLIDPGPLGKQTQSIQTDGGFAAQLNAPKPGQPVAVPDLIEHARLMVHKGGGDMKVTLSPDGLGQVAMKVSVDQGKVNVQMITESDEAKKLIERQLGDLKTQLASHHLQLSDIKVDTATNLGRQLEQQYHDAQRQATQQAWEQFNQNNQGWRRSFFEVPSARVYKGQAEAPRDAQAPGVTAANSRRGAGSRRLDLVA